MKVCSPWFTLRCSTSDTLSKLSRALFLSYRLRQEWLCVCSVPTLKVYVWFCFAARLCMCLCVYLFMCWVSVCTCFGSPVRTLCTWLCLFKFPPPNINCSKRDWCLTQVPQGKMLLLSNFCLLIIIWQIKSVGKFCNTPTCLCLCLSSLHIIGEDDGKLNGFSSVSHC